MKIVFKVLIVLLSAGAFSGCASLSKKYKNLPSDAFFEHREKFKGKTPKEIVRVFGDPISVGWHNPSSLGKDRYYVTYVVGNGETSMGSFLMVGEDMTCRYFFFYQDNDYKQNGQTNGVFDLPCADMKKNGWYVYDDAMIK